MPHANSSKVKYVIFLVYFDELEHYCTENGQKQHTCWNCDDSKNNVFYGLRDPVTKSDLSNRDWVHLWSLLSWNFAFFRLDKKWKIVATAMLVFWNFDFLSLVVCSNTNLLKLQIINFPSKSVVRLIEGCGLYMDVYGNSSARQF